MSDHTLEDRQALKLAQRRARIADAQFQSTLKWIMSTPQGRQWMYDLLALCHIGHTPFTGNNDQTNFQCGEQNIGLRLWSSLQSACPDLFVLMMQESQQRELTNGRHSDAEYSRSPNADGGIENPGDDLVTREDAGGNA